MKIQKLEEFKNGKINESETPYNFTEDELDDIFKRTMDDILKLYDGVKSVRTNFRSAVDEYVSLLKSDASNSSFNIRFDSDFNSYNRMRSYSAFNLYFHVIGDENCLLYQTNGRRNEEYAFIYEIAETRSYGWIGFIQKNIEKYTGEIHWNGYNHLEPYIPVINDIIRRVAHELQKMRNGISFYFRDNDPYTTARELCFELGDFSDVYNMTMKIENVTDEQVSMFSYAFKHSSDNSVTIENNNTLVIPIIDILFYKKSDYSPACILPTMINNAFNMKLKKFDTVLKRHNMDKVRAE